jgi:hypothetical protein
LRLPVENLVDVLGHSKVRFSNGGGNRLAGRIPLAVEAHLSRLKGKVVGEAVRVDLTDLSVVGVGVALNQQMFAGEQFILQIVREGATVLVVRCVVKRCARKGEGRFNIGAEYVSFAVEGAKVAREGLEFKI